MYAFQRTFLGFSQNPPNRVSAAARLPGDLLDGMTLLCAGF